MLHYHIDHEVMSDLYRDFCRLRESGYDELHALGQCYLPLREIYELDKKTCDAIRLLCEFQTETELKELENRLVHGYVDASTDLRKEQAEYKEFAMSFEGETQRALLALQEYVVGKMRVPYKIKNRDLLIQVIETPAMTMALNFKNVLIMDGRHPREILISRLSGERFTVEETVKLADGTQTSVSIEKYRLSFINALTDGAYQTNVSTFEFTGVEGRLQFFDYHESCKPVDVNGDKLPWRLLMDILQALMDKARILGVEDLNPTEMAALPFLCVFYELIEFYLETTTQAGIGRNLMHYNEELVRQFAFNQEDLNASAQFLESAGLCDRLTEWLKKADSDRNGFARFWIQYVSMRSGERLYSILMGTLTACAKDYPTQAMPVAYEKHNPSIRRFVNDCFGRCKWYGEFPYFYRSRPCKFLETSNVCGKMYSYINEKEKAFYVDFVEGFDGQTYSLTAIAGYVLLRNDENTQDYQAMSGYFLDDGRRFSHVVGQINMDYRTESREIGEALEAMIADAMGIYG